MCRSVVCVAGLALISSFSGPGTHENELSMGDRVGGPVTLTLTLTLTPKTKK